MLTGQRTYTIEEYMALPDNGVKYELVKGELLEMPPTGGEHGEIDAGLIGFMALHIRKNKLGRIYGAETAFVLNAESRTVRAPDIAFVAAGRLPVGPSTKSAVPIPPDLAVEIVSPSDSLIEVEEKVNQYLEAGVRLVWVINPRRHEIYIYRTGSNQRTTLGITDELDGEDVIKDFKLKISEIFEPGN